ncbi:MAG: hypothetical protein U0974_05935 [Gemmatimonadales bacterium]|nr:hypothetical protein [Gemmatimonadales bacterium]
MASLPMTDFPDWAVLAASMAGVVAYREPRPALRAHRELGRGVGFRLLDRLALVASFTAVVEQVVATAATEVRVVTLALAT